MKYDERVIEEVQSKVDIVELVGSFIPLKRSGRTFKALCPFHQEKTPSFIVNPERQIFHCFGCNTGGDAIAFLEKYENMTFLEALRQLAERVHVQLPEAARGGGENSLSGTLYAIYEAASDCYRHNFEDAAKGKTAREYLERRGFSLEGVKEFGIGYALPDWRGLCDALLRKGFSEELLVTSGLATRGAKGVFDLLRARLIFPIRNVQGKVVAFGGRILTDELPKYINSPETEIFKKRREFYGLHAAKRFIGGDEPRVFVVEGYLDQIRMVTEGFRNTVATLGTALTEDHVRLLKRYAAEAVLLYDGDRAGQTAALRGLDIFLAEGMAVKLVTIPGGKDPDKFIAEAGGAAMHDLARSAQDVFDFKLSKLLESNDKREAVGLMRIVSEFTDTLNRIPNAVLLDRYIRKLAGVLGVDHEAIRKELAKKATRKHEEAKLEAKAAPGAAGSRHEWTLLGLLAAGDSADWIYEDLLPEEFEDKGARSVFEVLVAFHHEGRNPTPSLLASRLGGSELISGLTQAAFQDMDGETRVQALQDCIHEMRKRKIRRAMGELQTEMRRFESSGESDRALTCMKEYQAMLGRLRAFEMDQERRELIRK